MGLLDTIFEKLGMRKPAPASKPVAEKNEGDLAKSYKTVGPGHIGTQPVSEVDVAKKLDALAEGKDLNWKVSIVDMLKLLDIDSSREARNKLALELGCPPDQMEDSARMNIWLHKAVMKKIAANGGNVPASLLD